MKITETRKEIINLISDYMDKTLSEWCLFIRKYENNSYSICKLLHIERREVYWNITTTWYYYNYIDLKILRTDTYFYAIWWKNHKRFYDYIDKIIWHYDITAVLKYIENNRIEKSWYDRYDYFTYTKYLIQFWKREEWFDAIPNKPLHLYTEEEDKQLLDLLIKLK